MNAPAATLPVLPSFFSLSAGTNSQDWNVMT